MNEPLKGRTILVVEDNALIARELAELLGEAGASVVGPAATVQRALELMADRAIELAVLDIALLGEQTSLELAQILAAQHIPFCFVSAYPGVLLPHALRSRPFLTKPFAAGELIDTAASLLEARPPTDCGLPT